MAQCGSVASQPACQLRAGYSLSQGFPRMSRAIFGVFPGPVWCDARRPRTILYLTTEGLFMKLSRVFALLSIISLMFFAGTISAHAAPVAPTLLGPANGASVTEPFAVSWSAVTDPSGILAYNWEVSPSSSMTPVIKNGSTMGPTQDTVSGLANGTYFWHVDAVSNSFVTGAWSATRSFTVTGANAGASASPILNPIPFGAAFHPLETFPFSWTAVPGAVSYTVDAAPDPNFTLLNEIHSTNIVGTSYGLDMGQSLQQGTWYLRVSAVNANGVYSQPSNVRTFVLSWNAPLPPPPTLLSPANGTTVSLPVTLSWTDVPNPQNGGYTFEVATDPQFKNIEDSYNQNTANNVTETNLSSGTKYWRVLASQGDNSPTTPAQTAWSATGTFVVTSHVAAATPSVTIASPFSGDTEIVTIQLSSPAPAGGSVVTLTSSNPAAAPLPATFTMPAGMAFGTFNLQLGQVTAATPVTLTESVNGTSASVSQTVQPPSLKTLWVSTPVTGGSLSGGIVYLNGSAPAGGAVVHLTSSNPTLVPLPATVTILAGNPTLPFNFATNPATVTTPVTLTASWNGSSQTATLTVTASPPQAPASLTLSPTSVTAGTSSTGTVTLATPASSDTTIALSSGIPGIASVPASVVVPAGSTSATFSISTFAISTGTTVTLSASAGGVTTSADLTVLPAAGASLSSVTVSPASIQGGTAVTGTATLTAPAPSGGALVTLSSNSAVASVASGITIPAGSSSATFTVTTAATSSSTPVTIAAAYGGVTQSATLTVTGAPADKVAVTLAEYDVSKGMLNTQATSSSTSATLKAFVTSTGAVIGTLTNVGGGKYQGQFAQSANPQNITITSSLGGSATAATVLK